jgi:hypothetical protein
MQEFALLADVVWPSLLIEGRLVTVVAIVVGLGVELIAVRYFFNVGWKRAAIVDVAMNAASTILGIVLIPLSGFLWEIFPGSVIYKLFNWGTFNPVTWTASVLLAALVNTAVESQVVRFGFNIKVTKVRFWILFLANLVSVGVAVASLVLSPVSDY